MTFSTVRTLKTIFNTNLNVTKWAKNKRESPSCVNHYTASFRDMKGELSAASLAVSLPVYEACFSLTVSGIKRANPS